MKTGPRSGALTAEVRGPLLALIVTYVTLVVSPWGRHWDQAAYAAHLDGAHQVLHGAHTALSAISLPTLVAFLLTLVAGLIVTGRPRLGLRAGTVVVGAGLSAEALKPLIPALIHGSGLGGAVSGSFPSGHATLAAAMSLATLGVLTPRWRHRVAGPLAAWMMVIGVATVAAGWHRPSDAIGGILLAAVWHRIAFRAYLHGAGHGRPALAELRRTLHDRMRARAAAVARGSMPRAVPRTVWIWSAAADGALLTAATIRAPGESATEPSVLTYLLAVGVVAAVSAVVAVRACAMGDTALSPPPRPETWTTGRRRA